MLSSFHLLLLPQDLVLMVVEIIMSHKEFTPQDRMHCLVAYPKLRLFTHVRAIRTKISSPARLRELYKRASSFHACFPTASFANIWLLQVFVPKEKDRREMLSVIFQIVPTITDLNIMFDHKSDFSNGAFSWLISQAPLLKGVSVLRIKFNVASDMLKSNAPNPWRSSIAIKSFLRSLPGLRMVLLRTPLIIAPLNDDDERVWVESWAKTLPLIERVYMAHAFDDEIGEGDAFTSGRRSAFLRDHDNKWMVKGWWSEDMFKKLPIKLPVYNNYDTAPEDVDPYDSDY